MQLSRHVWEKERDGGEAGEAVGEIESGGVDGDVESISEYVGTSNDSIIQQH